MSAGERPLRFLNPWLYSDGHKVLTDIADDSSVGYNGVTPYASRNAVMGLGSCDRIGAC